MVRRLQQHRQQSSSWYWHPVPSSPSPLPAPHSCAQPWLRRSLSSSSTPSNATQQTRMLRLSCGVGSTVVCGWKRVCTYVQVAKSAFDDAPKLDTCIDRYTQNPAPIVQHAFGLLLLPTTLRSAAVSFTKPPQRRCLGCSPPSNKPCYFVSLECGRHCV